MQVPVEDRKEWQVPGARVTNSCEPRLWALGTELGFLQEQPALLTAKPSFQPQFPPGCRQQELYILDSFELASSSCVS